LPRPRKVSSSTLPQSIEIGTQTEFNPSNQDLHMQDGIQSSQIRAPHVPTHTQQDGTSSSRVPQSPKPNKDLIIQDGIDSYVNVPHDIFQTAASDGSPRAAHGTLNPLFYLDSFARSHSTTDSEVFPIIIEYLHSLIEVLKLKTVHSNPHSANPYQVYPPTSQPLFNLEPSCFTEGTLPPPPSGFSRFKNLFKTSR
jgi:hypothetical protein